MMDYDSETAASTKFPHTRAQLAAISRQFKDSIDQSDTDLVPQLLLNQVVSYLVQEKEDELKDLLKITFGLDDDSIEHSVLELMHKHRDDVAGVPFLFLTPTRRPISRPSSRASMTSSRLQPRPDTPASAPSSPFVNVFRRPHTPATSPLAPGAQTSAKSDYSPSSSPILSHAQVSSAVTTTAQWTASLPASPLSSPRLLNAKAHEFRPIPRPLSAAAHHGSLLRADTPSPDLWAHNSPRAPSNLAIAAPLIAERPYTPSSSSLRSSTDPKDADEEEDDPFDPFNNNPVPSFHSITISDFDDTYFSDPWSTDPDYNPPNNDTNGSSLNPAANPYTASSYFFGPHAEGSAAQIPLGAHIDPMALPDSDDPSATALTDGMTPFDVLTSVFGSSLAPSELEEALAANGFDFERAMAWLVDRALPPPTSPPTSGQASPPAGRMQHMGNRVTLVSRDGVSVRGAPAARGFTNGAAKPAQRFVNGRPVPNGNRVCRYFVAGECLRADCRFSHDLERALCRFWLRGTCAKNESCEFLHHLPKDVDMAALNTALARANVPPGIGPLAAHTANLAAQQAHANVDEFPVLGYDANNPNGAARRGKFAYVHDPSRTRFAAAVKKSHNPSNGEDSSILQGATIIGGGAALPSSASNQATNGGAAASTNTVMPIIAPRPSPRLKLRPPLLLPTLPTGASLNALYMSYRSRALQLGAARNACLSRAADAWRRGDGAAAKRFSREGAELNKRMADEMREAAGRLVRERARVAEGVVRARDSGWSDDPRDRSERGRSCAGGLGVVLGVASVSGVREAVGGAGGYKGAAVGAGGGAGKDVMSADERTEAMLDLHGLHANEATDVLEQFLMALERESFYGLAYAIVGEEKHTGTQDIARGASRARLAAGVREWLYRWGYPWSERDGVICIDPLTHE
ncbi:hypothetical protein CVT24_004885 [Panaeolus cyanescens]|uniref:C3H1-type domain-containing protein n=1 Tax=Panaeolus cyanescens TaxID=181874 RepID=A0A409W216_9AGAR|nr:hypothetical protein CVT24_004885 [Panaeolus cyanescens]